MVMHMTFGFFLGTQIAEDSHITGRHGVTVQRDGIDYLNETIVP